MPEKFQRTELLIGSANLEKLKNSKILVCGVGGVGSFVAEALARSSVGKIGLIDYDRIDVTNINRQIHATEQTVGNFKTEEMKKRILQINDLCEVDCINHKITEENVYDFISGYDYVIDAIDMIPSKIAIIKASQKENISVISSMGAANKLRPEMFEIADIYKTSVCPLAKIMRSELKKAGIKSQRVCYSRETPQKAFNQTTVLGSVCFTTATAGLIIAGEVIRDLCGL